MSEPHIPLKIRCRACGNSMERILKRVSKNKVIAQWRCIKCKSIYSRTYFGVEIVDSSLSKS